MLEESASAIPSSLWASMNSWFTPTVFFVLLNVMIGTIAITSSFSNQKQHQDHQNKHSNNDLHQPTIAKSPSVLQRLKSVNFYSHFRSQEPQQSSIQHKQTPDPDAETQAHYFFQGTQENGETIHQSQVYDASEHTLQHNPQESQTSFDFAERNSNFEDFQMAREENVEGSGGQSMDEVYSQLTGNHFIRTKSDTEPASGEIPAKLPTRMRKSASVKSAFAHFEEEEIVEARRPATMKEKGNADFDEEVDAKADDFINKFKQQLKLQRLDSIIRYKNMIGKGNGGR